MVEDKLEDVKLRETEVERVEMNAKFGSESFCWLSIEVKISRTRRREKVNMNTSQVGR